MFIHATQGVVTVVPDGGLACTGGTSAYQELGSTTESDTAPLHSHKLREIEVVFSTVVSGAPGTVRVGLWRDAAKDYCFLELRPAVNIVPGTTDDTVGVARFRSLDTYHYFDADHSVKASGYANDPGPSKYAKSGGDANRTALVVELLTSANVTVEKIRYIYEA